MTKVQDYVQEYPELHIEQCQFLALNVAYILNFL